MSYRTSVNGTQIFGNNEYYTEWIEFIRSQGVEVDEDGLYEGEITDVMGAVVTIEKIVLRMEEERRAQMSKIDDLLKKKESTEHLEELRPVSLFDFRRNYENLISHDIALTDAMSDLQENAYIFMSCAFIDACGDSIEGDKHFSTPNHFMCYKIKKGCAIKVSAG